MLLRGLISAGVAVMLLAAGCATPGTTVEKQVEKTVAIDSSSKNLPTGAFQGQQAPDFTLNDLSGKTWKLSDLRGHSVALVFWASWCPPCKEEIPMLIEAQKELPEGSKILAVNVTSGDKLEDVKALVAAKAISYPVLLDVDGTAGELYAVRNIPNTVVLDKNGVVVDNRVGAYDSKEQLLKLLKDNQ